MLTQLLVDACIIISRLAVLLLVSLLLIYFLIFHPPQEPKIPAVPFWVTLLPLFKDVDQLETYNRYIRKPLLEHGAVKLFFSGQWVVLVEKPSFLSQIFKYEDTYQKSGNQKKIPGSVLASFLGDNIISSHGQVWRNYQEIMKPGLQEGWSIDAIHKNASQLRQQLQSSDLPLTELIQRYTIANIIQLTLGTNIDMMHADVAYISQAQNKVKRQIFKPIFMSFPFLDTLGIKSREQARQDAAGFTDHLVSMVEANFDKHSKSVGNSLVEAWQQGRLNRQQMRDNVTIVFVAGQENPQLAILSTLYLLAKHPAVQEELYSEVCSITQDHHIDEHIQNMPHLTACIYESLRLMPPIGQLVNRLATSHMVLNDTYIPKGTYIGYNSYATNRDPAVWGDEADQFVPARWGDTAEAVQKTYRMRRARSEFISFHGGRRACLGERFAILQLKITLILLCQQYRWKLDSKWSDRMTPVSLETSHNILSFAWKEIADCLSGRSTVSTRTSSHIHSTLIALACNRAAKDETDDRHRCMRIYDDI